MIAKMAKIELNQDILINFAPIPLTFVFTVVILLTVFHKLKIRWPVRANCWFCNYDASIWRHEMDWWLCPSCRQYNGFSKDGDYKYLIPEQRKMPQSATCYTSRQASNSSNYKNCLCVTCNNNEELKLLELRKFEGVSFKKSEKEAEKFKQTVEEMYPLCSGCKQVVSDVLHKQSLWLTRYKMMFFKQRPIEAILNNGFKIEKIFRILLIIMDSVIIFYSAFWPLSIAGVILQLGIFFTRSTREKEHDILLVILWICISILSAHHEFNLIKPDFKTRWKSLEHITKYHFITALGSIIGFMNIRTKSYKVRVKNVSFKRLDISVNSTELQASSPLPTTPSPTTLFSAIEKLKKNDSHENALHSPVNVTNFLMNSESLETEIPVRSDQLLKNSRSFLNQFSVPKNIQKVCSPHTRNWDKSCTNQRENLSLNDSLHNLRTLSLSQVDPEKLVKTSNIFESKVYSTSTSILFSKYSKTNKTNKKKSILAPPKLKSVTQESWVAGGYWQAGMEPPSLSRSSSQSSGFGSAGSNLGPSREPSVYNDFDQCSILSDTTQCCCSSRRHNQISFNSDCRLNSLFVRPSSPTCSQISNLKHSQTSFHNTLPLVHFQMNNSSVPDQCSKSSECLIKHSHQMPIYTGHTTVITSPVWLPALLCGSLIFNIIVLCSILLHYA